MSEKYAPPDMIEGYLDGYNDDRKTLPDSLANRTYSYKHGWLNGRDDRMKKPRAPYQKVMKQFDVALEKDSNV